MEQKVIMRCMICKAMLKETTREELFFYDFRLDCHRCGFSVWVEDMSFKKQEEHP